MASRLHGSDPFWPRPHIPEGRTLEETQHTGSLQREFHLLHMPISALCCFPFSFILLSVLLPNTSCHFLLVKLLFVKDEVNCKQAQRCHTSHRCCCDPVQTRLNASPWTETVLHAVERFKKSNITQELLVCLMRPSNKRKLSQKSLNWSLYSSGWRFTLITWTEVMNALVILGKSVNVASFKKNIFLYY